MEQFCVSTQIVSGSADFSVLPDGIQQVLIVTDHFLYENKMVDYVTQKLKTLGVDYEVFHEVKPDPDLSMVACGLNLMEQCRANAIIAFGGGSAIDAAKAIRFMKSQKDHSSPCFFIAIPTTSGTGSEVSRFSVLSDPKNDAKYPLVDNHLLPDVAILDAELTKTVPAKVMIDTGIDVLTHAIEAYVSKGSNDFTDAAAEKSLKLVHQYFQEMVKHPENDFVRQKMHHASTLAGIAFSNGGLGINHSMAHTIGGHFHLPHGRINGLLLPYIICFNSGYWDELTDSARRYQEIAVLFHVQDSSLRQSIFNLIRLIKQLRSSLQIPGSLKEAGISFGDFKTALPAMVKAALEDRCTDANPRICNEAELYRLFERVYEGNLAR